MQKCKLNREKNVKKTYATFFKFFYFLKREGLLVINKAQTVKPIKYQ